MELLRCTSKHGKVAIPISKIIGICEPPPATVKSGYNLFIATGADGPDGEENGWYVRESFDCIEKILRAMTVEQP